MPYTNITQLPEYVQKYSEVVQRQFMYVWNTVYENTNNEKRAFLAANAILGKRFEGKSKEKQERQDIFNSTVDKYLKNI